MSKYGLQLRVKPQQKPPARPPPPKVLGFDDDDDDDNVERDILRQAYKKKTHKDVEEQHKKVLEEDPLAFDYDGVYDQMKEKQVRPKVEDRQDRKPRYIQGLIDKAKQREREHEIIYERKLAKERSQDEHLYADKDKFVTSAYKKKLAEQAKWIEEERFRELREQKEDVTTKADLSDFYFNLSKNVAFGSEDADKGKSKKHPDEKAVQPTRQVSPATAGTSLDSSRMAKTHQDEIAAHDSPKDKPHSSSIRDQVADEQPARNLQRPDSQKRSEDVASAAGDLPGPDNNKGSEEAAPVAKDHHKRSEDALAAAKERFLARKKAKTQTTL
ncbi:nuclear speckle splicing regulatory protein 1-like [Salvia splendens]|uniref:nuclear speckle splicing regulatory protein 1-like n=1 Tax=Salvia splendens TaxID=180675 RepID=UPI001C26D31C|nr:nuclear speckle splicing regulatory protein 1-like [Salvia splendens]